MIKSPYLRTVCPQTTHIRCVKPTYRHAAMVAAAQQNVDNMYFKKAHFLLSCPIFVDFHAAVVAAACQGIAINIYSLRSAFKAMLTLLCTFGCWHVQLEVAFTTMLSLTGTLAHNL
eukprot:scaffold231182_cov21-Tisochrysis_lutea.AAC.1